MGSFLNATITSRFRRGGYVELRYLKEMVTDSWPPSFVCATGRAHGAHAPSIQLWWLNRAYEAGFIGFNPAPIPNDLIGQLAWYKKSRGLNLIDLGKEMNRDP